MKEGPDISQLAALIGDPGRANMLSALMSGKALTAGELAAEAGVSLQTASAHLSKLEQGGLISREKQGRHRYFRLADAEVAAALEALMGLAAKRGHLRHRTGPKDPALRRARVCYNHLAGELGVQLYDSLYRQNLLVSGNDHPDLSQHGRAVLTGFGIVFEPLTRSRAPLCRDCLDWSARRNHLAGSLGRALLTRIYDLGWAARQSDSRIVSFSPRGETAFHQMFTKG